MMLDNDFLVSFLADARGGTGVSKRLKNFKIVVPKNCLNEPTRIQAKVGRNKPKKRDFIEN